MWSLRGVTKRFIFCWTEHRILHVYHVMYDLNYFRTLFSWVMRWSCLIWMQFLLRTIVYNTPTMQYYIWYRYCQMRLYKKGNKWYISLIREKSDVIYWSCRVYDKERKRGKCSFTVENWLPPSLWWGCVSLLVCCSSLQYSH